MKKKILSADKLIQIARFNYIFNILFCISIWFWVIDFAFIKFVISMIIGSNLIIIFIVMLGLNNLQDQFLKSHYVGLLETFQIFVLGCVGWLSVTILVFYILYFEFHRPFVIEDLRGQVSYIILLPVAIFCLYRSVKGLSKLEKKEPF